MLERLVCVYAYACMQHLDFIWICFCCSESGGDRRGAVFLSFLQINFRPHVVPCYECTCWCFSPELVRGTPLGERAARDSHSIGCVQIGGSNNSITAANSLMGEARVQKRQIMQSRPAGNCCPRAISFDIGQASIGITERFERYGLPLIGLIFLFEIQSSTNAYIAYVTARTG